MHEKRPLISLHTRPEIHGERKVPRIKADDKQDYRIHYFRRQHTSRLVITEEVVSLQRPCLPSIGGSAAWAAGRARAKEKIPRGSFPYEHE